ncbi:hypothetical protein AX14_005322, partial [Amanita brunnescens Koide BX004]
MLPLSKPEPKANTKASTSKTVRWSFEPADDSPTLQPFWDHSNEFSQQITSLVTATVTVLLHIPMETAISTAIQTVKVVGPAPASKATATKSERWATSPGPSKQTSAPSSMTGLPKSPNPQKQGQGQTRSSSPSPSRPSPLTTSTSKPANTPVTFAQLAASVLGTSVAGPLHPAKAKPT